MLQNVIQSYLSQSFSEKKENIALHSSDSTTTYSTLDIQSNRIANWIREKGIKQQSFIGAKLSNRADMITVIIGILKAGCVFVPFDNEYPEKRIQEMIQKIDLDILITDSNKSFDCCNGGKVNCILLEQLYQDMSDKQFYEAPKVDYSPDDKIYVYYTSGTTGEPKAIIGRNASLLHFIKWEIDKFNISERDKISQFTSPCHDPFLRDVFVPLCCGASIVIPQNKEVLIREEELINWIDQTEVSVIHCTPSLFRVFNSKRLSKEHFILLKHILLAGERIDSKELKKWYDTFGDRIQLTNLYGPTETTLAKAFYHIQHKNIELNNIPIGKPISNTRIILLDEKMNICDVGVQGELYIRTPYRTYGYYKDDEMNKFRFIINPFNSDPTDLIYKTGDIGRVLKDGNIELLGRADRQIKIRGFRVELEEIEKKISEYEGVKQAAVISIVTGNKDYLLYAYFVEETGAQKSIDLSEIKEYLSNTLPDYMIPNFISKLDQMPINSNGKVDFKELANYSQRIERKILEPRDPVEKKIVELYCKILDLDEVSIDDKFMEIGGHSLNIMTLVSELYETFEIDVSLEEIFNNSTVMNIAQYIRNALNMELSFDGTTEAYQAEELGFNIPAITALSDSMDKDELDKAYQLLFEKHKMNISTEGNESLTNQDEASSGAANNIHDESTEKKAIHNIHPFNTFFYKGCFYNSLFPIVEHFGGNIMNFLARDLILYNVDDYNHNLLLVTKYKELENQEKILNDMGIQLHKIKKCEDVFYEIEKAIDERMPVILWVDCFYEKSRNDAFQRRHLPHTLLIFGYDKSAREFDIVEHTNADSLTYRRQRIPYEELLESHMGFQQNYMERFHIPTFFKFSTTNANIVQNCDLEHEIFESFRDSTFKNSSLLRRTLEHLYQYVDRFGPILEQAVKDKLKLLSMIDSLNKIINSKQVELYRIKYFYNVNKTLIPEKAIVAMEDIVRNYSLVRSKIAMCSYGKECNSELINTLTELLSNTYQLEEKYISLLEVL